MPRRRGPLPQDRSAPPERVIKARELISQMRYDVARKELMAHFGISRSSATRALAMARLLLAQQEEELRPHEKAVWMRRLERLFDKAEAAGEFGEAVRAFAQMAKARNWYTNEDKPPAEDVVPLADLTDEELEVLAKLDREKAAASGEDIVSATPDDGGTPPT